MPASAAVYGSLMCFWTTVELRGTEEEDASGFDTHTMLVRRIQ